MNVQEPLIIHKARLRPHFRVKITINSSLQCYLNNLFIKES